VDLAARAPGGSSSSLSLSLRRGPSLSSSCYRRGQTTSARVPPMKELMDSFEYEGNWWWLHFGVDANGDRCGAGFLYPLLEEGIKTPGVGGLMCACHPGQGPHNVTTNVSGVIYFCTVVLRHACTCGLCWAHHPTTTLSTLKSPTVFHLHQQWFMHAWFIMYLPLDNTKHLPVSTNFSLKN
jgi:hypothetical protein